MEPCYQEHVDEHRWDRIQDGRRCEQSSRVAVIAQELPQAKWHSCPRVEVERDKRPQQLAPTIHEDQYVRCGRGRLAQRQRDAPVDTCFMRPVNTGHVEILVGDVEAELA